VFLNIHNIHVQYAPVDGVVSSIAHQSGTFHPAYFFEKSQYNERLETYFRTAHGSVRVDQIAGQLARRCVSFLESAQRVTRGDPMGLIKFGSRVDMWFPKTWKTIVVPGQRLFIGDAVAIMPDSGASPPTMF
jgi:phosphatidylserine decarboxylase